MKMPKVIFFYENRKLIRHKVGKGCSTEIVDINDAEQRYRCRDRFCAGGDRHDYYGYGSIKEAKAEEIRQTKQEMLRLETWLFKLGVKNNGLG